MAITGRFFLQPIRASLSIITSPSALSRSRLPCCLKFEPLKRCVRGIESLVRNQVRSSHWNLCSIRRSYANNFCKSGCKIAMGSVIGASVVYGSIFLGPRVAYAMNGFDVLGIDYHSELPNSSETEEDPRVFLALAFARKLVMPVFLFITMLMNWDHPIILAAKVILILVVAASNYTPTAFLVQI